MKRIIILVVVILCFCFITACSYIDVNSKKDETKNKDVPFATKLKTGDKTVLTYGPCDVLYVIDGDTLMINIDGIETKVRLIGINTPESVSYDESRNNYYGKKASDYTKSLIEKDNKVYLEYDEEKQDKYGRDLAYVYFKDGQMLNYILLQKGYAQTMTIAPNTKHSAEFKEAETYAKNYKVGFWAEAGEEIYK